MSVIYDDQYNNNYYWRPTYFFTKPEKGDFTPFYITVALCTVFGVFLCVLNIFFCCCSKHKHYWQDSNTGNRWILPIWNKTPHKQPPLDYTELDKSWLPVPINEVVYPLPSPSPVRAQRGGPQLHELQKIETVAILALFIACCIMILLRWGPKLCKVRHTAKPDEVEDEWSDQAYEQRVSYA